MKNFARWKVMFLGQTEIADAEQFMVDIPEEASRDTVIAKLVLEYGVLVSDGDRLGFQEDWPPDIQGEFDSRDPTLDLKW